jgi:GTPase SAR1 family protein
VQEPCETASILITTLGGIASDISSPDTEGGLHVLGRGVKELVQKVQALRHLGVEDLVLPLPKIVVVGDQSTGKSSLIEGMSEIKVPRSAGTCTRCPLEINLTESLDPESQWSCEVYLHKKYVYQGTLSTSHGPRKNIAKSEGATRNRPLGPWVEQDSEDLPFASLNDKDKVVDALERAQLATLNPGSSYEKYKPGNTILDRGHQVKFSPNVIRLDISGPGLPNLSFYDLPGVINVTDVTEEAYLVDLVRNLVKEYIKAENCINLLALTMTHDAANSSAFGLIKELKAEARTMGCLTKPDRREPGEALDQWVQILHGQKYQLGFGYHVIKNNPNPRVDHATARREEAAFFSENEPWTTELSAYSDRFGTLQLQSALSQHLTEQIRTRLVSRCGSCRRTLLTFA